MAELKSLEQDLESKPNLAGSIFINNTSYSGADIKIVVACYGQGQQNNDKIDKFEEELIQSIVDAEHAKEQIHLIQHRLAAVKPATPEQQSLLLRKANFEEILRTNQESIPLSEKIIKKLQDPKNRISTKVLAEAQTISISSHRDKQAVRSLGSVYPKGFSRGPRMLGGSIIFTVFDENVLFELLGAHASDFDANTFTAAVLDQLPPVDIVISFANEYGSVSRQTIYGVEFVDEGQVMSIENLLTENTVSWVSRDLDPMRSVSSGFSPTDPVSAEIAAAQPKRASDLLLEEDFKRFKDKLDPYGRQKGRFNPFL